jgi:heme exporter protein B
VIPEQLTQYATVVWAVAAKDFRLEARAKRALPMAAALSLLVVVVFAFAFEGRQTTGALWVAFVFAGMLSVMQSVGVEGENSAIDAILLSPIPYSAIYVGKVLSATVFVTGVGLFTLAANRLFLGTAPSVSATVLIVTVVAFAFGFAAAAVVVAAIAVYTQISDLLLPVLLVPLVIPALLAGVRLLAGGGSNWFTVIAGYDGIVFVSGVLVFEELVS